MRRCTELNRLLLQTQNEDANAPLLEEEDRIYEHLLEQGHDPRVAAEIAHQSIRGANIPQPPQLVR